jgi:hypothetical protein
MIFHADVVWNTIYLANNSEKIKLKKMTRIILLLVTVSFINTVCGQYFSNVNNELCYELYRTQDALSQYRVFIVIDREATDPGDTVMLAKWNKFSQTERINIAQSWAIHGRRIEVERVPYITNPAQFTHYRMPAEMKRDTQPIAD